MFKKFIGFVVILSLLVLLSLSAFAAEPLPTPVAPTSTTTSELEKQISALLHQVSLLQEMSDLETMTVPEADLTMVSQIGKTSAVVVGSIEVDGSAEYQVEFGENNTFDRSTVKSQLSKNHKGTVSVYQYLTGLKPGTEYFCRLTAKNAKGVSVSRSIKFTTAPQDYLPLRLIAEAAGYEVLWQGSGKPIVLSGYDDRKVIIDDYVIIKGWAHIRPELIPYFIGTKPGAIWFSFSEVRSGTYRISVSFGGKTPEKIEQSFISRIGDSQCSVVLYSDGNDQQPGGSGAALIEITAKSVKL